MVVLRKGPAIVTVATLRCAAILLAGAGGRHCRPGMVRPVAVWSTTPGQGGSLQLTSTADEWHCASRMAPAMRCGMHTRCCTQPAAGGGVGEHSRQPAAAHCLLLPGPLAGSLDPTLRRCPSSPRARTTAGRATAGA